MTPVSQLGERDRVADIMLRQRGLPALQGSSPRKSQVPRRIPVLQQGLVLWEPSMMRSAPERQAPPVASQGPKRRKLLVPRRAPVLPEVSA